MKLGITIRTALTLALFGLVAGNVYAGISTTKHNLSTSAPATNTIKATGANDTEICVFCHTPHMTIAKSAEIPLWNHTLSTVASYGTYTSPTFDGAATIVNVGSSVAVTNLCLSCHDGTVAINSVNNPSNVTGANPVMGTTGLNANGTLGTGRSTNLGTDLTNDHPVNFVYDETLDTGLDAKANLNTVKLYANKVQCASCHDPHSNNTAFVRITMTGSALCLECHLK